MSADLSVVSVTAEQARSLTDRIKVTVEGAWHLITEAYTTRAYLALGYTSWDDYCTREFGTSRLRLPREERSEVVASLRESGLSIRAIAAATNEPRSSIGDLVSGVRTRTPDTDLILVSELADITDDGWLDEPALTEAECEALDDMAAMLSDAELARQAATVEAEAKPRVTGIDGKSYPKPTPTAPKRTALTESFWKATYDLGKGVTRVTNLAADDRFKKNTDQIREKNLSDLIRARDALQCVIDQLTAQEEPTK